MTDAEFSEALGRALGVCRDAAGLKLPIAEMLEFVEDAIDAEGAIRLSFRLDEASLEALREILASVGEVAAIGAKLPGSPPAPPPGSCPIPANALRGA